MEKFGMLAEDFLDPAHYGLSLIEPRLPDGPSQVREAMSAGDALQTPEDSCEMPLTG